MSDEHLIIKPAEPKRPDRMKPENPDAGWVNFRRTPFSPEVRVLRLYDFTNGRPVNLMNAQVLLPVLTALLQASKGSLRLRERLADFDLGIEFADEVPPPKEG